MVQKGEKKGHFWEKVFKNDLQGMLLPIALMALIGSINIFSATYVGSITTDTGLLGYAPRHLGYLLASAILGVLLYRFDYRRLQNAKLLTWIMGLTAVFGRCRGQWCTPVDFSWPILVPAIRVC